MISKKWNIVTVLSVFILALPAVGRCYAITSHTEKQHNLLGATEKVNAIETGFNK